MARRSSWVAAASLPAVNCAKVNRSRIIDLAKAAGARFVEGPYLDFLDPWGNRLEIIEYSNIQFTKAPNVMRGMGLALAKNDKAKKELADKGMDELVGGHVTGSS